MLADEMIHHSPYSTPHKDLYGTVIRPIGYRPDGLTVSQLEHSKLG